MKPLNKREFVSALRRLPRPGEKVCRFLELHAAATGRASTMSRLANAVRYAGFQGMNLQYGLLAKRVGIAARRSRPNIELLVEFIKPKSISEANISNSEWVLVMREPFAKALVEVGWIEPQRRT